jgi:hypothetical protein
MFFNQLTMKYFFLSVCFVLLTNIACAGFFPGDSVPPKKSKYQLGLNAGLVTGFGLSFRYAPTSTRFMHQITFLPVVTSGFSLVDLSYSVFYRLKERKYTDFNLYLGSNFIMAGVSGTNTFINITGGGFGFDFKLGNYFSLNLNSGFAVYNTPSVSGTSTDRSLMLLPTGEIGLFYKL